MVESTGSPSQQLRANAKVHIYPASTAKFAKLSTFLLCCKRYSNDLISDTQTRGFLVLRFLIMAIVINIHLKELSCLIVGETSCLGVALREQDGSDFTQCK